MFLLPNHLGLLAALQEEYQKERRREAERERLIRAVELAQRPLRWPGLRRRLGEKKQRATQENYCNNRNGL